MKRKNSTAKAASVKYVKTDPIEVCRSLETCRKAIISNGSDLPYCNPARDVILSLEEAIVNYAIILGDDDPARINEILNEIEYTGTRAFEGNF